MKTLNVTIGTTRLWWLVLAIGILLVLGGFAYWFWRQPICCSISDFRWLLVLAGVVQLCVGSGPNRAAAGVVARRRRNRHVYRFSCLSEAYFCLKWFSPIFWQ